MRMRRKKHLLERLDKVKDYLIIAEKDIINVNEAIKDKRYINFKKIFGNDNPVELEIGCGKGSFICEKANRNSDTNYIAVEMLENIILLACENALKREIKNVRFLNTGGEYLPRYLENNSIQNIYLNFSTPYPKKTYENRRLTNDRFLKMFKELLVSDGCVYQKTDDKVFFDYSFNKFLENGYKVIDITEKINYNEIENIRTEYETKFLEQGLKIYGLIAKKGE